MRDRRIARDPARNARTSHDKWNRSRLFIHRRLTPQTTSSHVVAMVAGVDHAGVLIEPGGLKRTQDLADVLIEKTAQSQITGHGPAQFVGRVEIFVVDEAAGVVAN